MNSEERNNLLFILIVILVFIYLFTNPSENFDSTYKYKCGDTFKYKEKNSAEGKCPPSCPAKINYKDPFTGTYNFYCQYDKELVKKQQEELVKKQKEEILKKQQIERNKAEEFIRRQEEQIRKQQELNKKLVDKAGNIDFKPIIEQEY